MKTLFFSLLAVLFSGHLFAADLTANFATANRLYAEGKFSDAAAAYQKILDAGNVSFIAAPLLDRRVFMKTSVPHAYA